MVGFKPVKCRQRARGIEKGPRPCPRSNLDFTLLQLLLKKSKKRLVMDGILGFSRRVEPRKEFIEGRVASSFIVICVENQINR
jgi:hypothetical protein